MRKKGSSGVKPRAILLGVTILFALAYSTNLRHSHTKLTAPVAKHVVKAAASLPPPIIIPELGLPIRLQIPRISVDASVLYMGLTTAGDMAVPGNVVDVGWYKNGPHPGNKGSAVIAGHLDGLRGEAGVFANLDKLQKGDSISVVDDKGQVASFTVREVKTYDQTAQPSEVFNNIDGTHLNLITCTGAWSAASHLFSQRLVVFTDKAS